jgi:hypothetical protein
MVKAGRRSVADLSEATIEPEIAGPRPLVEGGIAILPLVAEETHGSSAPVGRICLSASLETSISPPRFGAAATTASSAA